MADEQRSQADERLRDEAASRIEAAFRDAAGRAPDTDLSEQERRQLRDEFYLLDEEDLRWALPRILLDTLHTPHIAWTDVYDILADLNVPKAYPDAYLKRLERNAHSHGYEDRTRADLGYIRARRAPLYAAFTQDQARAIVAFLDAVRDAARSWDSVRMDWEAAKDYWQGRAEAELY